nr:RHS repeat-associated core domain-containing protein [Serratia sp. MYb239]
MTQQDGVRSSYHYHCDPNGAPVRLTDVQGELVCSEQCGVWGEPGAVHADRVANPLRFQGQYFDAETGLHYNRYRYYDPQTGSYISQDPIGLEGGINLYAYAPNPLGWIDYAGYLHGSYISQDPIGCWGVSLDQYVEDPLMWFCLPGLTAKNTIAVFIAAVM